MLLAACATAPSAPPFLERTYVDFWQAVAALDFDSAERLATMASQRAYTRALREMAAGHLEEAQEELAVLARSEDSSIARKAEEVLLVALLERPSEIADSLRSPLSRSLIKALLGAAGQLTVTAEFLSGADLRLGIAARHYCPDAHTWFITIAQRLGIRSADTMLQWSTLAKITALTGTPPDAIGPVEFERARTAIVDAFIARGSPGAGRNLAAIFHRLRLTLFHAGRLDTYIRPRNRPPVSVRGWAVVAPGLTEVARRYVDQIALSLRPSTVEHIEHDLREFGTWLADHHPQVAHCADLERHHIEHFKAWLSTKHGRRTGKRLNRISIKNRLINLHCFFDRITDWGYPNPPQRPLVFAGDLPIVDKPLPRFLDDAAAAKLLRVSRADPDPLARLIVELLARTGMRSSELRALTIDAVVQIGSAYWLRVPIGNRVLSWRRTLWTSRWRQPAEICHSLHGIGRELPVGRQIRVRYRLRPQTLGSLRRELHESPSALALKDEVLILLKDSENFAQ